jgi:hypothetical protein
LISTGFPLNTYYGSLMRGQRLCRYLPLPRFYQLLKNGLWFTRVVNWRKDDPCEAMLLPWFRNELVKTHRDEVAVNWMTADLELALKSSLGCCFMIDDGIERTHMWRVYCPESSGYGVIVRFKAKAVNTALQRAGFTFRFLKKVEYLTDIEAVSLTREDLKHSHDPNNPSYFNAFESLFYKRKSYQDEGEVRAVVSNGTFRRAYLTWFASRFCVPTFAYSDDALKPENIPPGVVRIRMTGSRGNFYMELDQHMTKHLTEKITTGFEATFPELSGQKGRYLAFDPSNIMEIIVHANIWKDTDRMKELVTEVSAYGLNDRLRPSALTKSSWY